MAKRYKVIQVHYEGNKLLATVSPALEDNHSFSATGRMLVDSEQLAFLYLLDSEDGYYYIAFHHDLWEKLKEGLDKNLRMILTTHKGELLELEEFYTELTYLIHNMKDNPNYGEKIGIEVEKIFF